MRYNFLPSIWILVYVILVWPNKRINLNEICKNPELVNHEIVVIENDTYRYSLHYEYSMRIQHNKPQPVSSERFYKINLVYTTRPEFSSSFYGKHVQHFDFYHDRNDVYEVGGSLIGNIYNYIVNYKNLETKLLNDEELLGVQRNFLINVNGSEVTATMSTLLHPNGKVSFYYDNIPKEIKESQLQSKIVGPIICGDVNADHEIPVPAKWIKSGTLVEFEAIGEICSQYNTSETCQNATTSTMTCFWCEKGKKCIESNDQNTHGLKVNDCRVEKTSDVNDLSTSTPIKDIETTLTSTEVQVSENLIETTDETDKHLVSI
ncbi:unnamed protein product [Schistosoma rodhaini]|nr:unnamed protein product [Schistosoma rodhaini]